MPLFMRPHSFVSLGLLGAAGLLAACSGPTPTDPATSGDQSQGGSADLAQVRAATAAFHNIDAARAAGYTVWSPDPSLPGATCPSDPAGKMGYHLVNVNLRGGAGDPGAGDALLDARTPEMLLYERRADGELRLVGVEYLVFKAAWERVHGIGAAAPTVLGQPVPFSSHTFVAGGPSIEHYELHVWLWTENPLGMFAPWNPTVTC